MLNGDRVHYRPGWDCHGLPIELKVIIHRGYVIKVEMRNSSAFKGAERWEEEQTERPHDPVEGAGGGEGHGCRHDGFTGG